MPGLARSLGESLNEFRKARQRKQGPQNYSKALEHYNKAIQLKPNLAEAYEYRGVLFLKMGRKVDAERDLATLKALKSKLANELEQVIQTGNKED